MAPQSKSLPNSHGFLPDFCNLRAVLTVVVVGELLAIILTLSHAQPNQQALWQYLGLLSLFIQWLGLSSAAILCTLRRLLRIKDSLAGIASYLILLINTLIFTQLAYTAIDYTGLLKIGYPLLQPTNFLLQTLGIAAIIYALLLRYLYMQHQWQQQLKTEAESRFQLLQARIRPHFLFNTMNTIASLIHDAPHTAEQVVLDFAELLRATLNEGQNAISLQQELELCRRYLEIEQLRLGERLHIEWKLGAGDTVVPPLLIQPLIENAVYHGIEPSIKGGTIEITCHQEGKQMLITISNPLPEELNSRHGHHLAQHNIQQRLALVYGDSATLQVQLHQNRYRLILTLPITQELRCAS